MRVRSLITSSGPGWGIRRATRPRQSSWTTPGSSAAPTTRGSLPWRRSAPTFVRMIWQMMILWSWIQANRFSCGWVLGVARLVFNLFLWFYSYCPWIYHLDRISLVSYLLYLILETFPLELIRWILFIESHPFRLALLWILSFSGSYPSLDLKSFWPCTWDLIFWIDSINLFIHVIIWLIDLLIRLRSSWHTSLPKYIYRICALSSRRNQESCSLPSRGKRANGLQDASMVGAARNLFIVNSSQK